MKKLIRYAIIFAIVIVILAGCYHLFCTVRSPEIDGIVIDKETKKPVQNAWIMAVVETDTRTFGGDVSIHRLITRPHTRTDGEGKFNIPSHFYYSAPPPLGWGMRMTRLRIDVYAPGPKRGAIDIYTYKQVGQPIPQDKEASIEPTSSINEKKLSVIIPTAYIPMTNQQIWGDLGKISGFCQTGRYGFARPEFSKPCDIWELDYVIEIYKTLKDKFANLQTTRQIADYSNYLQSLASLYKKRGDYQKAIEYYIRARDFDKKNNINLNLNEYEIQINDLKKILE